MLLVSVYKGAEREIQVFGLTWSYAIALFIGLLITVALYILGSVFLGLGFLGLSVALMLFIGYVLLLFRMSKRFGKGGLLKALARVRLPDCIRGGVTLPTKISVLSSCSSQKRK